MEKTLAELAVLLDAELLAAAPWPDHRVSAVGPLEDAGADQVTYWTTAHSLEALRASGAAAVLVSEAVAGVDKPQLVVGNLDEALIKVLTLFAPPLAQPAPGFHASAVVDPTATLGRDVCVGPGVVIEAGACVGDRVVLGAGCVVGQDCWIGADSRLDAHVVVYPRCRIGERVVIQANSTIGAVGFGYAQLDGRHQLIPHNGAVVVEDDVEIGANCCIDRAKFTNTIVGSGTKIDNQVQIGHNVRIGKGCLICAQVGIAGSTVIGDGVVLGGQVGLADNITIGDGVMVGGKSGVMNDVPAGQKLLWSPALEQKDALRILGELVRLPKTAKLVKQLTKRLERLEGAKDDQG